VNFSIVDYTQFSKKKFLHPSQTRGGNFKVILAGFLREKYELPSPYSEVWYELPEKVHRIYTSRVKTS
jgi:hypothetical protein